jgi:hypothetical protein
VLEAWLVAEVVVELVELVELVVVEVVLLGAVTDSVNTALEAEGSSPVAFSVI